MKHLAKYILVEWRDSGSVEGIWQFKDEWQCEVHTCYTVGIEISNNKDKLVVAQSMNNDQWGRLFAIPKENIRQITELKELKK
jgi:hypothetical protein